MQSWCGDRYILLLTICQIEGYSLDPTVYYSIIFGCYDHDMNQHVRNSKSLRTSVSNLIVQHPTNWRTNRSPFEELNKNWFRTFHTENLNLFSMYPIYLHFSLSTTIWIYTYTRLVYLSRADLEKKTQVFSCVKQHLRSLDENNKFLMRFRRYLTCTLVHLL